MLLKELSEAHDKVIKLETNYEHVSSKVILKKIKPNNDGTFFKQANIYLEKLKESGNFNQYIADKPRIKHFSEFLSGSEIAFSDITIGLIERFKHYLKTEVWTCNKKMDNRLSGNNLFI